MDQITDQLISAVQSRTPLWDMRDRRYHSRDIQRKHWAQVADEVGSEVEATKKKWKGLRDYYRREHKKIVKSGQEAPDEFLSSWHFFVQMHFLSDIIKRRKLEGNLSSQPTDTNVRALDSPNVDDTREHDENSSDRDDKDCSDASNVQDEQVMAPPPTTSTIKYFNKNTDGNDGKKHLSKKGKRKADAREAKFLEIEEAKLKLFLDSAAQKDDSDLQFLRSLLPFLKKVPEERKLMVRHNLLQVLIDEERSFQSKRLTDLSFPNAASHSSWSSQSHPEDLQEMANVREVLNNFSDQ